MDQAEAIARSITNPSEQEWPLAGMAKALARAGDCGPGRGLARSITSPS